MTNNQIIETTKEFVKNTLTDAESPTLWHKETP